MTNPPPPPPWGPQPPYQPPPGYPPPPPPRRSNLPLIAVIVAVSVLLCGGAVTAGVLVVRNVQQRAEEALAPITNPSLPSFPTQLPQLPEGTGKKITVTYEVTGDGPADIVYTEKLGESPKQLSDVDLPWTRTTTMEGVTLVSVTAIGRGTSAGTISCTAEVDGEQVARSSREGLFATANCTKMVLG